MSRSCVGSCWDQGLTLVKVLVDPQSKDLVIIVWPCAKRELFVQLL